MNTAEINTVELAQRVQQRVLALQCQGVDNLGALFDLTSQRLVRLAVAITRNQHDAEDVVQTVLVRVAAKPGPVAQANSAWAYLLRMVRNEAIGVARKKKRWVLASNTLADLVSRCRVDELEREETHREVWAALRKLPAEQAEVVVLKIWEGMTFAEIGEVLETSPHTSASRYQAAMSKLAQRLKRHRSDVGNRPESLSKERIAGKEVQLG